MIQKTELKLGNIVLWRGQPLIIKSIYHKGVNLQIDPDMPALLNHIPFEELEPIKISSASLRMLGFSERRSRWSDRVTWHLKTFEYDITVDETFGRYWLRMTGYQDDICLILTIHQLQNILSSWRRWEVGLFGIGVNWED